MFSRFLRPKKLIDSYPYNWSFLSGSFSIWYKVMSSFCYIFSLLFLFHWISPLVANSTFSSETSVILLLLKFLPSNAAKKLLVKKVERKLEQAFSDGLRGDVQLKCFTLLSVPNSQQLHRLTALYFFSFSRMTVETCLHFSLTTNRCSWTINFSWKLETIPLQVTSYKAPFKHF